MGESNAVTKKEEKLQVKMWVQNNAKLFPEGQALYISKKMEGLKEEEFLSCSSLDYKDPTTMTIISVFLGGIGVDRFMLGDTGMGVLKLLTAGCCGILWLIDIFSISKKTKDYNMNKMNLSLAAF